MKFVFDNNKETSKSWHADKAVAYFQCCGSNVEKPLNVKFSGRTTMKNTMKIVNSLKQKLETIFASDDEYPSVRIVYKNSLNYIVDEHIVWIEF